MKDIAYAAYNEEFIPLARDIFDKMGKDIEIQIFDSKYPEKLTDAGIKVVMARGGTVSRVRRALDIPVVEIPVPFEDMIEALIRASKLGRNIGVVGYDNIVKGLDLLNPLLNVKIKQVFADNENDMKNKILELKEEGTDVIVGGVFQTNFARSLNLESVRINFTEKALSHAYSEAESIYEAIISNVRRNEELNAILDHTKEGYIAIDKAGKISLINETSLKLIPGYRNPIGSYLVDVFPELEDLLDVLKTGEEVLQEVGSLKNMDILYDMIPLKLDKNQVIGAIATFNDINMITKAEHKIRNQLISKGLYASHVFDDIKGKSRPMRQAIQNAKKFSLTDSTVMIIGETGVGKELFAQSIHNMSKRKSQAFVAVNCGSLPESLLESELFGYEEGAFTGAKKGGKAGLFELAHKGTIFLDEISEMPLNLQTRFLRALQERKIMRLGGNQIIPIDVRVIAATNKKMEELVNENKFRDDLFYRINVLTVAIPPLRNRKEDIYELTKEFWKKHSKDEGFKITESGIRALEEYGWPGNARQLENFIEKLNIINESDTIDHTIINNMIRLYEPEFIKEKREEKEIGHYDITKEEVEEALKITKGNRTKAAEMLGIHRTTLWRFIKREF